MLHAIFYWAYTFHNGVRTLPVGEELAGTVALGRNRSLQSTGWKSQSWAGYSLLLSLGCQHVLFNYGDHPPYLLLHVLHILNGGVEGGWLLLPGFFGHIKKTPGSLAKQKLRTW